MTDGERLLIPGVLIASMIVCSAVTGVWDEVPAWPAGIAGWAAACLLWRRLPFPQRLQSLILIGIGVGGLLWGALDHGSVPLAQSLSQNHALLSMITAVSFLRLVSVPRGGGSDPLPRGRKAFVQTLLGAHFFGGVISRRLPTMGSEISLFLAAGVLAVGLTEALASLDGWTPFEVLNSNTATLTLVVIIALAALGLHPVISIATIGASLAPLDPDPNLLATMFLMGWGVGVTASPLSGIHLILQGRYHLAAARLAQGNWLYVLTMLCLCAVILQFY